jgi:hypothetical protein
VTQPDLIARLKLIRARRHHSEQDIEATVDEIEVVIRELEQLQTALQRKARGMRERLCGEE